MDFPKLRSPFIRTGDSHLVTPDIDPECSWFLDEGVRAVDKLDGTNVLVVIENNRLVSVSNRKNSKPLNLNDRWTGFLFEGVGQAVQRRWLPKTGNVFGELIGPSINGNRHQLTSHYFVPFDYLKNACHWKSWVSNTYPKDFQTISEWFQAIPSLFNQRMKLPEVLAEGIVFHHPDGRMCKLRRDMFDWYKGPIHG